MIFKLVSITGGLGGVFSFISRIFFGILLDKIPFNRLMPMISLLLSVVLSSIYFLGQISFIGIIACVWWVMSAENDSMYLTLFLMLAGSSLITIPATWFVSAKSPTINDENKNKM